MPGSPRVRETVPVIESEEEERQFWLTADSTEYVDWSAAMTVRFPNLRPSSIAISVRLPDTRC